MLAIQFDGMELNCVTVVGAPKRPYTDGRQAAERPSPPIKI
jgi:hypothetical protein